MARWPADAPPCQRQYADSIHRGFDGRGQWQDASRRHDAGTIFHPRIEPSRAEPDALGVRAAMVRIIGPLSNMHTPSYLLCTALTIMTHQLGRTLQQIFVTAQFTHTATICCRIGNKTVGSTIACTSTLAKPADRSREPVSRHR